MKCLSIAQPWAWAILFGPKRVENRTWHTDHRGPLLLHAGQTKDWLCDVLNDGTRPPPAGSLAFGALLGVVDLISCVHLEQWRARTPGRGCPSPELYDAMQSPFAEGPYCWVMCGPRPFVEPVPYRGARGLFDVPESAFAHVARGDAWEGPTA